MPVSIIYYWYQSTKYEIRRRGICQYPKRQYITVKYHEYSTRFIYHNFWGTAVIYTSLEDPWRGCCWRMNWASHHAMSASSIFKGKPFSFSRSRFQTHSELIGVFGNILRILRIYILREWLPLTRMTDDCASFLGGVLDLSRFLNTLQSSGIEVSNWIYSVEKEACQKMLFCIAEYTYEKWLYQTFSNDWRYVTSMYEWCCIHTIPKYLKYHSRYRLRRM